MGSSLQASGHGAAHEQMPVRQMLRQALKRLLRRRLRRATTSTSYQKHSSRLLKLRIIRLRVSHYLYNHLIGLKVASPHQKDYLADGITSRMTLWSAWHQVALGVQGADLNSTLETRSTVMFLLARTQTLCICHDVLKASWEKKTRRSMRWHKQIKSLLEVPT